MAPCVDKPQTRSLHMCQRGMGWWKGRGRCWWLHSISRARIIVLGFPLNLQLPESGDSVRLNQSHVNIPSLCWGGCQGGESKGIPKITNFIQWDSFFFQFFCTLAPCK